MFTFPLAVIKCASLKFIFDLLLAMFP